VPSLRVLIAALALVAAAVLALPGPAMARSGVEADQTGLRRMSTGSYHSCAVTAGRRARCWGEGANGKLGVGTEDDHGNAVTVLNGNGTAPLADVLDVVTGQEHTCALLVSRQVRCWGSDTDSQLGNGPGPTGDRLFPFPVRAAGGAMGNLTGVRQITAGYLHMCALLQNGQVRCWGDNEYGKLGNGNLIDSTVPVVVRGVSGPGPLTDVVQIDGGEDHTCALLSSGQVRCWGWGYALGRGNVADSSRPVVTKNVAGNGPLVGVTQVSAGSYFTCARLQTGQARCWGVSTQGELGYGSDAPTSYRPVVVTNLAGSGPLGSVASVSAGEHHGCAVVTGNGGQARCWGPRNFGQLGDGVEAMDYTVQPVVVRNVDDTGPLVGVTQLETNNDHTCVRLANGQGRCWGEGSYGQLGDDGTVPEPLPRRVQS
jgi:alpha-tubulin suppressor-like RCC1 family protein